MSESTSLSDLRCTAAEVLAAATLEVFPNALLVQGYVTRERFCYDFFFPFAFQEQFLPLIEEKMRAIVKQKLSIKILEMVPNNAAAFLEHHGQLLRAESARHQNDTLVEIIQMGKFVDFCDLGSFASLEDLSFFKLQEAFELKKEKRGFLTRIVGSAFFDAQSLKKFVKNAETFQGNDHLQLGAEMDLFHSCENRGEEMWLWHPKGESLRQFLMGFWRKELEKQNFQFVSCSYLNFSDEMTSAHVSFFKSFQFLPEEIVYLAELSNTVEPLENSSFDESISSGMLNAKMPLVDRQHIFCHKSQLLKECISSLQFILKISKIFGFEHRFVICSSSKKEKVDPLWKEGVESLKKAAEACQCPVSFETGSLVKGFSESVSGPRIEMRVQDALGREWVVSYFCVDCTLAKKERLNHVILVRSLYNSLERFIALLIEQHLGRLPFWVAPEQVRVCEVNAVAATYVEEIKTRLELAGIRVRLDSRAENLGERIYDALRERVPYCIVVGEKEKRSGAVAVRTYSSEDEEIVNVEVLLQKLQALNVYTREQEVRL